mmetsp:Transcript_248/g.556  ORF Transcript_248/g.556 Transcript_248/m.556 type:complete len:121 (-) Transcript_248:240-602(-)
MCCKYDEGMYRSTAPTLLGVCDAFAALLLWMLHFETRRGKYGACKLRVCITYSAWLQLHHSTGVTGQMQRGRGCCKQEDVILMIFEMGPKLALNHTSGPLLERIVDCTAHVTLRTQSADL